MYKKLIIAIFVASLFSNCGGDSKSNTAGIFSIGNISVCEGGDTNQLLNWELNWSNGNAFISAMLSDKDDYSNTGLSCCVDEIDNSASVKDSIFDIASDIPNYSYLSQIFVPGFIGGTRQMVTHVNEGGVSQPKIRLSLWREDSSGSCNLEKVPAQSFVHGNSGYVDPTVGGINQHIYGGFYGGNAEIFTTSIDPNAASPSWSTPTSIKTDCEIQRFYPCKTALNASYRAFINMCDGSPVAFRTADGQTFEEIPVTIGVFPTEEYPPTFPVCLTKGDLLYVVWSVLDTNLETYYFNALQNDNGAWNSPLFTQAPQIQSVNLTGAERLFLNKFWAEGNDYWAAFEHRKGASEAQTGSEIYFGRSTGGVNWTFYKDTSCSSTKCWIPDFVIFDQMYFYYTASLKNNDLTKFSANFFYNLDGDVLQPEKVSLTINDITDSANNTYILHHYNNTIGFLYWDNWDISNHMLTDAVLKLQRFEVK